MKMFLFLFLLAIKTAGSAQKLRVGRVSGNTAIFCLRLNVLYSGIAVECQRHKSKLNFHLPILT